MIRISKILLYTTVLLLIIWQLPWCYNYFFTRSEQVPFTLYSGLKHDFLSLCYQGENMASKDTKGNLYTWAQTDSLLPFFYTHQLVSDGRFPDSIQGEPVNLQQVKLSNFFFRVSASDLNFEEIGLYPLLESKSGRVDLVMPDDVFRFTKHGIEFVQMKTNAIDETKSEQFNKILSAKGFHAPARLVAGNPTVRKDYDEGYLLVDQDNHLFHLKQMRGRPYVRPIELPDSLHIQSLFITEFKDHKTLALIVDNQNQLYVLHHKSYQLYKVGIPAYDPHRDNLMIVGNMLDWTVCVETDKQVGYYAVSADDYTFLQEKIYPSENNSLPGLRFTSTKDKYVKPRFQ